MHGGAVAARQSAAQHGVVFVPQVDPKVAQVMTVCDVGVDVANDMLALAKGNVGWAIEMITNT